MAAVGKGPHFCQKNPQYNFLATGLKLSYFNTAIADTASYTWLLLYVTSYMHAYQVLNFFFSRVLRDNVSNETIKLSMILAIK